jgi:lysophosphatidylcholine acyltransferase/lyso-PAF acetyltransferase
MMGYSPVSFLSKEQVQKWPAIGVLATAIRSIYVRRDSEESKKGVKEEIRKRVEEFTNKKQNVPPLLIFPEGTTSNGKGLLTFKNGAFENLSPITAYCLNYECNYSVI